MVSKASELLPEPDTPLTTVSLQCGISQEMFLRLWVRAPRMTIASFAELNESTPETGLRPWRPPVAHVQGNATRGDAGTSPGKGGISGRLRTILLRRLRAQSPNFDYTAQRCSRVCTASPSRADTKPLSNHSADFKISLGNQFRLQGPVRRRTRTGPPAQLRGRAHLRGSSEPRMRTPDTAGRNCRSNCNPGRDKQNPTECAEAKV